LHKLLVMRTTLASDATRFGAMVLSCLGALAHCGGGGSGASPPSEVGGDSGPHVTTSVREGGRDLTPDGPPPASDGSTPASDGDDSTADVRAPRPRQTCQSAASCNGPSTMGCCGGYCVDTAKDPVNCGQCGVACTANQFCTGTACDSAIIANVCDNAMGTVAADPYQEDNRAGAAIGAALTADCLPPTMILQTSQSAQGVLDPGSDRPITGPGNTFITGGGGYGQSGVAYMETSITPLYLWSDGTTAQIRTRDGKAVVTTADTALTAHHDFFYVQLSVEPKSGTLCFSGVGMLSPGTEAAGYYAGTELIPNRAKYTANWYVYEWFDTNGDSIANAGDAFTQVMAGP
jgi:hypothetical protein